MTRRRVAAARHLERQRSASSTRRRCRRFVAAPAPVPPPARPVSDADAREPRPVYPPRGAALERSRMMLLTGELHPSTRPPEASAGNRWPTLTFAGERVADRNPTPESAVGYVSEHEADRKRRHDGVASVHSPMLRLTTTVFGPPRAGVGMGHGDLSRGDGCSSS